MTNQSHTELAAQARDWAVHLEQANVGRTDQYIAHTLRRCAAALESPERVQGGLAMLPREPNDEMCDQGAQALVSWENGSVWPESWGEIAARQYRKDARKAWVAMAETFLCATPSPQAEKQPLSDELCQTLLEAQQPFPRTISRDEFLIRNTWRACCEVHGIVTKEGT